MLVELVLDLNAEPLALPHPDLRAWNRPVVGPDGGFGVSGADEVRVTGPRDKVVVRGCSCPTGPGWQQRRGGCGAARSQEPTARKGQTRGCSHGKCTHPGMMAYLTERLARPSQVHVPGTAKAARAAAAGIRRQLRVRILGGP
jgi:hypothetical protein